MLSTKSVIFRHDLVGQGLFGDPLPAGSAYLFNRNGGGDFVEVDRFTASDNEDGDFFGTGMDPVIRAFRADVDGEVDAGKTYIFQVNRVFAPPLPNANALSTSQEQSGRVAKSSQTPASSQSNLASVFGSLTT